MYTTKLLITLKENEWKNKQKGKGGAFKNKTSTPFKYVIEI